MYMNGTGIMVRTLPPKAEAFRLGEGYGIRARHLAVAP
jgi:hypothetical protein